jgi:hypothetical protein
MAITGSISLEWRLWRRTSTDVCYVAVTILILALLQGFGICQYFGTGSARCQYFGTGNIKERLCGGGGATNKNQRVKHEKSVLHARVPPGQAPPAASPRACHRFHHPYASGRSLSFSSPRDIAPPERATPPTNRLLQRLRASCLPRALAAFDPGHGSCGGALAEVFPQSATLALIIPQAMNRPRPIRASRSSPRWTTMLHQVTPQLFSLRLAGRSV